MTDVQPVAIVGIAAIMPMAPDADAFWANITGGRYCITDVPPERWNPALYYSPDHSARDKTYSTIGGWVREFEWDPIRWKLPSRRRGRRRWTRVSGGRWRRPAEPSWMPGGPSGRSTATRWR